MMPKCRFAFRDTDHEALSFPDRSAPRQIASNRRSLAPPFHEDAVLWKGTATSGLIWVRSSRVHECEILSFEGKTGLTLAQLRKLSGLFSNVTEDSALQMRREGCSMCSYMLHDSHAELKPRTE